MATVSSFAEDRLLSELLGFAIVWGASWWKRLPQIHLDDSSNTETTVGGIRKAFVLRIAAAVSLVIFQTILAGGDTGSRWAVPLITIGVYALTRLPNEFRLSSPHSYALLNPSNWDTPKVDVKEPLVLPAISVLASCLLLWVDFSTVNSIATTFLLLVCGIGFFASITRVAADSEDVSEKTSLPGSQKFLRSVAGFAIATSAILFGLVFLKSQSSHSLSIVFGIVLRAIQAYGLVLFAAENALTTISTATVASIAAAIIQAPSTLPDARFILAFSGSAVQVALTAPKANHKRVMLFIFLFVPSFILPIFSNVSFASLAAEKAVLDPLSDIPETALTQTHPVEKLHQKWTKDLDEKLARQSSTIVEAVTEYKRRYNRQPPPGFDMWFQFAKENNYLLIDEFDSVMTQMEPFWEVSPKDLYTRMKSVANEGENIVEIEVINNKVERMSAEHWYTDAIVEYFKKFGPLNVVPDFNFTFNAFDEPRVMMRPTHIDSNKVAESVGVDKNNATWIDSHHIPVWPQIAPSCPNQGQPEVDDESAYQYSINGINFMDASSSAQDICVSRSLRTEHGFFVSPETMKLTHHVVPIFSQAAPQRFGDILYPTSYYYNQYEADLIEVANDLSWETKKNQSYWAGASTGGGITLANYKTLHRNRISLMTQPKNTQPVTLLQRIKSGKWKPFQSFWGAISKYFNINVTRLVQCEETACNEMKTKFNLGMQPGNSSLSYKYVLDIDGNSYTGRYYRLLRSKSCVIKSTIFREWHDDILTPWVHYIPLSNSAMEFGEMMRFLVEEPEGDEIGKKIGIGGKEWTEKVLRREDMEIYAMRVFMEYGRLFDEQRDTNGFVLP